MIWLPELPPMKRMTGLSSVNPQNFLAASLSPLKSSSRIGVPVTTAFPSGRLLEVSGKLQHILSAFLSASLQYMSYFKPGEGKEQNGSGTSFCARKKVPKE